jgi:hypothetical protein
VNGIDSTSNVIAAFAGTSYDNNGFEWRNEADDGEISCGDLTNTTLGSWVWADGKASMVLFLPVPRAGGISFPIGATWEILRLTKEDLWFSNSTLGNEKLLRFMRIGTPE